MPITQECEEATQQTTEINRELAMLQKQYHETQEKEIRAAIRAAYIAKLKELRAAYNRLVLTRPKPKKGRKAH
jgi:hypothetical protein